MVNRTCPIGGLALKSSLNLPTSFMCSANCFYFLSKSPTLDGWPPALDLPPSDEARRTNMTDSTIRRRIPTEKSDLNDSDEHHVPDNTAKGGLSIIGILRAILITLVLSSALSWFITGDSVLWGWSPWWSKPGVLKSWIVSELEIFQIVHRRLVTNQRRK
jgi:hypothetical protein